MGRPRGALQGARYSIPRPQAVSPRRTSACAARQQLVRALEALEGAQPRAACRFVRELEPRGELGQRRTLALEPQDLLVAGKQRADCLGGEGELVAALGEG